MRRTTPDRLVDRPDGPVREGLPAARQEAEIRNKSSQKKFEPEIRSDLHLQKYRIRVS